MTMLHHLAAGRCMEANRLGYACLSAAAMFAGRRNANHLAFSSNVACKRQKWKLFRPPNGSTFSREPREDSFGVWIYVVRGSAAATWC